MYRMLTALAAGAWLLAGCSRAPAAPNTEQLQAVAFDHCMASARDTNPGLPAQAIERYCHCSAEKFVARFSPAELVALQQASDEASSKALMPIAEACAAQMIAGMGGESN